MPSPLHHLVFESFGLVAEVVSDDRQLFNAVPEVLPPGWSRANGESRARFGLMSDGAITVDGVEAHRETNRRDTLLRLGSVVRHHLATEAPGLVFIHAGVVKVGDFAVVIPGRTYSGKTTLVAELVGAGATYCSDEYAVVNPEGMVQPFAKALSVRSAHVNGLGEPVAVPAERVVTVPIRAGLIVLTRYRAGARWEPSVCTSGEGAFALLKHTVCARRRPGPALLAVSQLSRDARVLSGDRGEASEAAHALLDEVDLWRKTG